MIDDLSRSDAQMLVCYRDIRQWRGDAEIDEQLVARVQAVVADRLRYEAAVGRLSAAKITINLRIFTLLTRVAQV